VAVPLYWPTSLISSGLMGRVVAVDCCTKCSVCTVFIPVCCVFRALSCRKINCNNWERDHVRCSSTMTAVNPIQAGLDVMNTVDAS